MDVVALERSLAALGLGDLRRLSGGWQSLAVYESSLDSRRVAVKVYDAGLVDRTALRARLDVQVRLRAATELVCAPVVVRDRLVHDLAVGPADGVHVVAYEFADGTAPQVGDAEDAAEMGRVLADLHRALAGLAPVALPGLPAFPDPASLAGIAEHLRVPTAASSRPSPAGPRQLLHGDLSATNVRVAGTRWRVFDFDDCGYGPVEVDVANSLYLVLFDALTRPDHHVHQGFRDHFLGGYRDRAGVAVSDQVLDGLITRRVLALASWLDEPDTAPLGVRNASGGWRATLGDFVRRYFDAVDVHLPPVKRGW